MSLLLHIDCATELATVSIANDGVLLAEKSSASQKDQASFLQPAIASLLEETNHTVKDLAAVAVVEGPGSYTGLRVGMASTKGLCFALDIPMITVGSLELLADAVLLANADLVKGRLICPMIDARRMEVFTALYDEYLEEIETPHALILDQDGALQPLLFKNVIFTGNGAPKVRQFSRQDIALVQAEETKALAMSQLAFQRFRDQLFTPVSQAVPRYLKEFFTP